MDVSSLQSAPQAAAPLTISVPAEQQAQNRLLIQAMHAVNATELLGEDSELTFSLDRGTQRVVIRVVNSKTKEVLRQIPSEDVLRVAEAVLSTREPG